MASIHVGMSWKSVECLGKGGHLADFWAFRTTDLEKKMAPVSTWSAFKQGLHVPMDILEIFDILSRDKNPIFNQNSESMKAPRYEYQVDSDCVGSEF